MAKPSLHLEKFLPYRLSVVTNRISGALSRHYADRFGIGIRFGDFYAKRLVQALGLEAYGGVVRVSMAHYNTVDEIDRLIRALEEVIECQTPP